MAFVTADRVKETTTSTGTGTVNLAGAVTGFQTFVAGIGNGKVCAYCIEDANGSAWEVGIGTVTDAAPDTLSRASIISSSSGSKLTLTTGTHTVFVTNPSAHIQSPIRGFCGGRLSLSSSIPVPTSNLTTQSTLYFLADVSDLVYAIDSDGIERMVEIPSIGFNLTTSGLAATKNYDVFLYENSGTWDIDVGTAWSNATTRAVALSRTNGVWFNDSGFTSLNNTHTIAADEGLYLGTIYTDGTTTFNDSTNSRFVWNNYNQVPRLLYCPMTGSAWTYSTNMVRASNSNSTVGNMRCDWVQGLSSHEIDLVFRQMVGKSGVGWGWNGIGIDSTSSDSAQINSSAYVSAASTFSTVQAEYRGFPGIGYHYGQCLENSPGGVAIYFYGTDGGNNAGGMIGHIWA